MRAFEEIQADIDHAASINDADALLRCAAELDGIGTRAAEASAHTARGRARYLRADYSTSMEHYDCALKLYEELEDRNSIARVMTNVGSVHSYTGDPTAALDQFHRALAIFEELGDRKGVATVTGNIGNAHMSAGDFMAALEHYHRAVALYTELGIRSGVASVTGNTGMVLERTGDFPAALEHYRHALALHEELGDRSSIARVTGSIGSLHFATGDYPTALDQFHRALAIYEELDDRKGMATVTGNIGQVYASTGDQPRALEYFHRALAVHEEIGDRRGAASVTGSIGIVCGMSGDHHSALEFLHRARALHEVLGERHEVARVSGNIMEELITISSDTEAQALLQAMDALQIDDPRIRIGRELRRAILQQRSGDLDNAAETLFRARAEAHTLGLRLYEANTHKALRDLALTRNDLAGYVEHNNEYTRITEEINGKETATKLAMQAKQREIDAKDRETQKQLAVLHSTLPKDVADRVARGEVVNDHFENATVIFLDIVGFTEISATMSSQDVIVLLDDVFTQCDAICAKHGVTKIKTIGDSYMCVAFDSVVNAALCALDMSRIRLSHEVSHSVSHNVSHEVLFRIGMHCGPVTAGVIGKERMQYDVWGDTVNVASRMESAGEPGRVHVSEAFALNLKSNQESRVKNPISESHEVSHAVSHAVSHEVSHAVPLVTIERGSIDIKGKGLMQTYWLESTQP
jgi:adenylate cyclase